MKTVRPKVRWSVLTSSSKSPAPIGSSPEVGSSRNTSSGSSASARASATRLTMPPESSDGKRSATSGRKPTITSFATRRKAIGDFGPQTHHFELCHHDLVEQSLRDVEIFAHRKL